MEGWRAFFGAFWTSYLFDAKNRVRSKGGADDAAIEGACFFAMVKGLEGFVGASDRSESTSSGMVVDREESGKKTLVGSKWDDIPRTSLIGLKMVAWANHIMR